MDRFNDPLEQTARRPSLACPETVGILRTRRRHVVFVERTRACCWPSRDVCFARGHVFAVAWPNGAPANGVRRAPLRQILAAMGAGTQLLLPPIEEGSTEHPWLLLADLSSGLPAQTISCVCLACLPTILFSHTKSAPATSYQPAVLFSHNKSAPVISHSQTNTAIETRNHG